MRKTSYTRQELKSLQQSMILVQGVFEESFFDMIAQRDAQKICVMEGRPGLEASKVACKELLKRDITPTVIADNMAGFLFYNGLVKEAWLAFEVTEKRGAMCHIGASIVALLAKEHQVPLFCYQGKPSPSADKVAAKEAMTCFRGVPLAPKETEVYAPLWEWVPGKCFIIDETYQEFQAESKT